PNHQVDLLELPVSDAAVVCDAGVEVQVTKEQLVAGDDLLAADPEAEVLAPELVKSDVPLVQLDVRAVETEPGAGRPGHAPGVRILDLDPGRHVLGEVTLRRNAHAVRPEHCRVVYVAVEVGGVRVVLPAVPYLAVDRERLLFLGHHRRGHHEHHAESQKAEIDELLHAVASSHRLKSEPERTNTTVRALYGSDPAGSYRHGVGCALS